MRQIFSNKNQQMFWARVVLRKWFNISSDESDFSADSDFDYEDVQMKSTFCKLRRPKSEILRSQYITTKEIKICVGTWNVGGRLPSDDLDIQEWLDMEEPADIYVLGFQEIVPLNAGNIFGAEDSNPAARWDRLIRATLHRIKSRKSQHNSYSEPTSPSSFKSSCDGFPNEDNLLPKGDIGTDGDIHPCEFVLDNKYKAYLFASDSSGSAQVAHPGEQSTLEIVSTSDRVDLIWPEQELDPLTPHAQGNSKQSTVSFKSNYSTASHSDFIQQVTRKRKSCFVRIISKQMVGIFLSIWVRRSLRKHIQNLKVSTVGVGVMNYIGNKGSVSVSMSIYQTTFCFICSHLASGEKDGDELRRNGDVQEICRRTQFGSVGGSSPKTIHDHERLIWFGDLNYRISLPHERTHELIFKKDWTTLAERDQLKKELEKGGAFDGWSEGTLNFPPTFKYEFNSYDYAGMDPTAGRRTPAWCDRVLSYGKGISLLDYRRSELKLSDHRPVTATFMVDVEVLRDSRSVKGTLAYCVDSDAKAD